MIKDLAATDHLPDYFVNFDPDTDMVSFQNRGTMKAALAPPAEPWTGRLDSDVYGDARNVAPGWDIHYLEREWRSWLGEEEIVPKNPEKMFVKFCQSWFEKRGRPK